MDKSLIETSPWPPYSRLAHLKLELCTGCFNLETSKQHLRQEVAKDYLVRNKILLGADWESVTIRPQNSSQAQNPKIPTPKPQINNPNLQKRIRRGRIIWLPLVSLVMDFFIYKNPWSSRPFEWAQQIKQIWNLIMSNQPIHFCLPTN